MQTTSKNMTISIDWPSFMTKWFKIQNIYTKMHSIYCGHHDATTSKLMERFEVYEIGHLNNERWLFQKIKKTLKLCFKNHIQEVMTIQRR